MQKIYPPKLNIGDTIAVIAPSLSFSILSEETIAIAKRRFTDLGLHVVFGQHIAETDLFASSSVENRLHDLHWAFSSPNVKAIFTAIGGFNSNQLLTHIDWEMLKKNPKLFCGYSDITALNNAIFAKTGLITYSGPHYSTFGQELYFDYTLEYVRKCLFEANPIVVQPSPMWSDDLWYLDQKNRSTKPNTGPYAIQQGEAQGTLVGGNLATLKGLQGTPYMPDTNGAILFLEDDYESQPHHFDRDLESLILSSALNGIHGIVFGRFQKKCGMTRALLHQMIENKKQLNGIPIIADVDFGHTSPIITLPIGGEVSIKASNINCKIIIEKH